MEIYLLTALIVLIAYCMLLHQRHEKEIHELYEKAAEERKELLDRIMANNIHEFKAATQAAQVKKSSSGNFLVDRMEKTLKKQYQDIE